MSIDRKGKDAQNVESFFASSRPRSELKYSAFLVADYTKFFAYLSVFATLR